MNKHTPGPWRVSRGAQADPFSIESETRTIAHVKSAFRHLGETEANARLIAAAPEMYEQLSMLVRWCEDQGETCAFARALLARIDGADK